ncbi:hypothetical protein C8R44DRAFT_308000 [Mycena epipterygia]|nr:hypothetical protein C8R44DRAFT_308000 [Mycena epipterygia]
MSGEAPSSVPGPMGGDIGTSYPSPVSTTTSPNMEATGVPPVAEPPGRGRPDTQHNLRAASAALQAAYQRIRQVRRSLVELTEPVASSDPDVQYLSGNIGPGHSALLLTASPVDESSDTDDAIDFQTVRSNLAAVDRQTQEYLDRFAPSSWSDHQSQSPTIPQLPRPRRQIQLPSPSSSAEPLYPPTVPRRSMLESQLAARRLNSDDAATFIGRRVALREAAGSSRAVDTSSQTDPIQRAVEMERELSHFRYQRRTDPGIVSRADALSRSDLIRAARSLDMESLRAGRQPSNISTNVPLHARPQTNPRRWRAYRPAVETRQNSNNTQSSASARPDRDRLSILSNFSVQNLSTPTSAIARDRPLLFEEPLSYISGQRRESRDIVDSPIGSERSYFIHRRVNADGDEVVHNINLEWDDEDPVSWLIPTTGRERSVFEAQDYSTFPRRRFGAPTFDAHDRNETVRGPRGTVPPVSEARRRGWARLDADGNAIPSDEEEELERARADYRMRALHQARASAAAVASRRVHAESGVEVPGHPALDNERNSGTFPSLVTRTSASPDDYAARETTSPRVRLNSRDAVSGQRLGFGTVMDSVLSVESRPRQAACVCDTDPYPSPYGSSVPFVVDPLPIPLSQMVPSKNVRKGHLPPVRVSRHAGLAGR